MRCRQELPSTNFSSCDAALAMLKNIESTVANMHDSNTSDDNDHSHAKENYYWVSSFPFSSKEDLPGRKTDEELRRLVLSKLKSIPQVDTSRVAINIVDQIVSITGSVQTYEQKRRIGEEIWKIEGVVKVLNELRVTEPSTAGPTRKD